MVDALVSGTSVRKDVEVQVLSSAPASTLSKGAFVFAEPIISGLGYRMLSLL